MKAYVLITEKSGIYEFCGIAFNEQKARKKLLKSPRTLMVSEDIDESRVINYEIYVGGSYDLSADHPDYRGIYYSQKEAKRYLSHRNCILKYEVPHIDSVSLEVH